MASEPGTKAYGILSVMIQAWYNVEYLFTVDENVFNPPPKVKSAVIRMTRNEVTDLGCDEKLFKQVVKATFNQRRKMLRVSLRQIFSGKQTTEDFFQRDIMTKRPEQLTIAQFVDLTNQIDTVQDSFETEITENYSGLEETINNAIDGFEEEIGSFSDTLNNKVEIKL